MHQILFPFCVFNLPSISYRMCKEVILLQHLIVYDYFELPCFYQHVSKVIKNIYQHDV